VAKFTLEQAASVAAINQVINQWAVELDINDGLAIASLVTEDVEYQMGASKSRAEVEAFYQSRFERLSALPEGKPVQRHALSNLIVTFTSDTEAAITFTLIYFTTAGMTSGINHADPAAVADVRMRLRADAEGDWRISYFDSGQSFKRTPS
jgi:ketosteroid isomerase-like protein